MEKKLVSPSFFKQKVRQLKKEKSISQHQAQDEVAVSFGYTNYKNYLNALEADRVESKAAVEALTRSIRAEQSLKKKVDLAVSFIYDSKPALPELLEILKVFKDSDEELMDLCRRSTLKSQVQEALLNYFIEEKEALQILPLREHFIAKDVFVKNLSYKLDGDKLYITGDYDLAFKFEYEIPKEERHLPHFSRDPMFGEFEAVIEKRKISFENPSIGENTADGIYMGNFKIPGLTRESMNAYLSEFDEDLNRQ